jgi:hypothetical protein
MALPVSDIPLDPEAFPHAVLVYRDTYGKGVTGAVTRTDGTGVPLQANVQLASTDKLERINESDGNAAGSLSTYDVSFAANPNTKTDDTILYGAIVLICNGPAAPVFGGSLFRVRCESRT